MKLKTTLFTLTFSIISCSFFGQNENDRIKMKLNGNVKYLTETIYSTSEKFGKIVPIELISKEPTSYFIFNDFGNIVESKVPKVNKVKIKYNDKQQKIEYRNYDSDGILKLITVFMYDEENLYEKQYYKSDGTLFGKYKYKYSKKGQMLESNAYDSNNIPKEKYKFKFDNNNNKIEEIYYRDNGIVDETNKYSYDNKNNLIESMRYDSKKQTQHKRFKYDDNNNIIEDAYINNDGILSSMTKYKYDYKGNKIESTNYSSEGESDDNWKYEYNNYDKYNNWTKQIRHHNNGNVFIVKREIIYFE